MFDAARQCDQAHSTTARLPAQIARQLICVVRQRNVEEDDAWPRLLRQEERARGPTDDTDPLVTLRAQ